MSRRGRGRSETGFASRASLFDTAFGSTSLFLILIACSFVIRILWWRVGPQVIEAEGIYYARIAENLAAGRGYVGLREAGLQLLYPPLYPSLIAVGVHVGLSSEAAGRAVSLLFGGALPAVVFFLGRRLYGSSAAWFGGVLAGIHPLLVAVSVAVLSESTSLTLSFLGVFFVVRLVQDGRLRDAVAAGLCFGAGYLVRPEALLAAILLGFVAAVVSRGSRRTAVGRAGVMLLVSAIFAVPYIVFLSTYTGQLRLEAKTPDALSYLQRRDRGETPNEIGGSVSPTLEETGTSNISNLALIVNTHVTVGEELRLLLGVAKENVSAVARGVDALYFGQPFLAILATLGLLALAWDRDRLRSEAPLMITAALTLTSVLVWPFLHDRFFFPLVLPLLVWAGRGFQWLRDWLRATADNLRMRAVPAAICRGSVLLMWLAAVCLASALGVRSSDDLSQAWSAVGEDKAIGQWLAAAAPARSLVMDSGPWVVYYSGAVIVPFPWADEDTALRYMEKKQVAFVIARDSDARARPYDADHLLRLPAARAELVMTFHGSGGDVRVYRRNAP